MWTLGRSHACAASGGAVARNLAEVTTSVGEKKGDTVQRRMPRRTRRVMSPMKIRASF